MSEKLHVDTMSGWFALLLVGIALLCMALISPAMAATAGKNFDHNINRLPTDRRA